jgi:hypothetical protein
MEQSDEKIGPKIEIGSAIAWYFRRGWLRLITIPLFLYLMLGLLLAVWTGVIQFFAGLRAVGLLVRLLTGLVVPDLFIWFFFPFPGGILLIPVWLWYLLLKGTPELWSSPKRRPGARTAVWLSLFVGVQLIAWFVHAGVSHGIGWIADRDPCLAIEAGLTGSQMAENCDDREHASHQARLRQRWLLVEPPLKKGSPTVVTVDSNALLRNWTVIDDFETLEACRAGLNAQRGKPPTASDLAYFPTEERESLTVASIEASRRAGCAFGASPDTPVQ